MIELCTSMPEEAENAAPAEEAEDMAKGRSAVSFLHLMRKMRDRCTNHGRASIKAKGRNKASSRKAKWGSVRVCTVARAKGLIQNVQRNHTHINAPEPHMGYNGTLLVGACCRITSANVLHMNIWADYLRNPAPIVV